MLNSWTLFCLLLVFAAIFGITGGYMFGQIKQNLPGGWTRFFNTASIVMLAQDVLANAACLFLILAFGVSLKPIGGPAMISLFFFAVVFTSPAFGFLLSRR